MSYTPQHLRRWSKDGPTAFDNASNYMGANLSEYWVAPLSVTRDSGVLERANWAVIVPELETLATDAEITDRDGDVLAAVQTHQFGHWACGWYELCLIHENAPEAVLRRADEWADALSDYPIADESVYGELELDYASEGWSQYGLRERVELCQEYGVSVFAARRDELPQDDDGRLFEYLTSDA